MCCSWQSFVFFIVAHFLKTKPNYYNFLNVLSSLKTNLSTYTTLYSTRLTSRNRFVNKNNSSDLHGIFEIKRWNLAIENVILLMFLVVSFIAFFAVLTMMAFVIIGFVAFFPLLFLPRCGHIQIIELNAVCIAAAHRTKQHNSRCAHNYDR